MAATFPIELSIGDARTPHGRVFTGFIRDLTERQRTERRLNDLQREIEPDGPGQRHGIAGVGAGA